MKPERHTRPRVVIAGGGVAALETLLALRSLVGRQRRDRAARARARARAPAGVGRHRVRLRSAGAASTSSPRSPG